MTALRKRMLEELQRRNYSPTTIRAYLHIVEAFARHFGKSPDKLDQEHLRQYQLHLLNDRKFTVGTIVSHIAALRFFFVRVLRRPYREIDLVYPKRPERLPTVLSQEEVAQLIASASNLLDYAMLTTLYATGVRRTELIRLKTEDIDSKRMIVHIRQGKGNRDREVPLTPKLLGNVTRVLALDETQDLSVSRHGRWLAGRQASHPKVRMDSGSRRRQTRRNQEARISAHAASQLGHTSARERDGPSNDPVVAGPCGA